MDEIKRKLAKRDELKLFFFEEMKTFQNLVLVTFFNKDLLYNYEQAKENSIELLTFL